jgi:urease subunit beta
VKPGEYLLQTGPGTDIELNAGSAAVDIEVSNTGDRPVQVGSHCHFFEVNPALAFVRDQAYGRRLDIPAGTAVRFEPGDVKTVPLVPFGGLRRVFGHRGAVQGPLKP